MNEMNGYDVEDLHSGMRATFSKTITEADIVLFAGVSGDNNALHINEEFAATTRFGGRIAHGFLTASVISAAVANRLPGPGTIYLSQQLNFRAPVRIGQTVHATVSVSAVDRERRRVTLEYIDQASTQNKRNLESDGVEFGERLRAIAADPAQRRDYLMRVSMIASLARAKELGAS